MPSPHFFLFLFLLDSRFFVHTSQYHHTIHRNISIKDFNVRSFNCKIKLSFPFLLLSTSFLILFFLSSFLIFQSPFAIDTIDTIHTHSLTNLYNTHTHTGTMYTNPYFAQLPTRRNRQDLAHALDLLPQLIIDATTPTLTPISPSTTCSYSSYSTPCSPSSLSSPSSPYKSSNHSHTYLSSQQQQYRHQLIKNNLFVQHNTDISSYHHESSLFLQFITRAQAMAFLIQILQSLQQPHSEYNHSIHNYTHTHNHIDNDEEREEEDMIGRAPCYICGEWYLELEPRKHGMASTSRSWHEQGSLRHHVAESRVRSWLDSVVSSSLSMSSSLAPSPQLEEEEEEQEVQNRTMAAQAHIYQAQETQPRPVSVSSPSPSSLSSQSRSAHVFSIPQEILDPSCRSPGFRIKNNHSVVAQSVFAPVASHQENEDERTLVSTTSCLLAKTTKKDDHEPASTTFRFSFTSSRFKEAVLHQASSLEPSQSSSVSFSSSSLPCTSSSTSSPSPCLTSSSSDPSPVQEQCPEVHDASSSTSFPTKTGSLDIKVDHPDRAVLGDGKPGVVSLPKVSADCHHGPSSCWLDAIYSHAGDIGTSPHVVISARPGTCVSLSSCPFSCPSSSKVQLKRGQRPKVQRQQQHLQANGPIAPQITDQAKCPQGAHRIQPSLSYSSIYHTIIHAPSHSHSCPSSSIASSCSLPTRPPAFFVSSLVSCISSLLSFSLRSSLSKHWIIPREHWQPCT